MEVLESLVDQLKQLDEVLQQNEPYSPEYEQLIDSRTLLLDSALQLQMLSTKADISSNSCQNYDVGTFCQAPRLLDRILAEAFVIGAEDDYRAIKWLLPRTKYELFSHGIRFPVGSLEPLDIGQITEASTFSVGEDVLVIHDDGVWYHAEVQNIYTKGLAIDDDNVYIEVQFIDYNETKEVINNPMKICKAVNRTESSSVRATHIAPSSQSENKEGDSEDDSDPENTYFPAFELGTIDTTNNESNNANGTKTSSNTSFRSWEKHTKGIGSQLLRKMGYQEGQGLGRHGTGRLDPLPIRVLPAGVALDFINEDPAAHKMAERLKQPTQRAAKKNDIFSAVNRTLAKTYSEPTAQSSKSLEVEGSNDAVQLLNLEEHRKKLEAKLLKLQQSLTRNEKRDPLVAAQVRQKIERTNAQLAALQSHESTVSWRIESQKGKAKHSKHIF